MGVFVETLSAAANPALGSTSPFAVPVRDVVLLVEDDESVACLVERILASLPARVMRVRTGAEAEIAFAETTASIAIVMVDYGLPDMDGRVLCQRLRRLSPQLPVLLTSGCAESKEPALGGDGPMVFLPKPFFPGEVRQQVNALLKAIA